MNRILYVWSFILCFMMVLFGVSLYLVNTRSANFVNIPPSAVFTILGNLSVGSDIVFDASASTDDGKISDYLWEFSDSVILRGMRVKRIFEEAGNYSVTLIVWDDYGAFSKITKNFEISERLMLVSEILNEPKNYLGNKIKIRGVFVDGYPFNFYVCDPGGYRCIRVYVEYGGIRPDKVSINDLLEICGELVIYKGELEVYVRNASGYYAKVIGRGNTTYLSVEYEALNKSFFESYNHTLIRTSNLTVLSFFNNINITILNTDKIKVVGFSNSNITYEIGRKIEVSGFLTYYKNEHEIKIRPGSEDYVRLIENYTPEYIDTTVDELSANPERFNGTKVHIGVAKVISVSKFYLFKISDINGSYNLSVYVEYGGKAPLLISPEDKLEIWGIFTKYQDMWEIKIRARSPDEIVLLNTSYPRVNISYAHILDSNGVPIYINKTVEIVGNVTAILTNTKIYVQDRSGGVAVYGLNFTTFNLTIGDYVCVRGYIYIYNGEEEIVTNKYYHFRKIGKGSIYILNVSTGEISRYEGNLVLVVGVVKEVYTGSTFYTITLDDGSGPCKIFIWANSGINISFVQVGDRLMVIGVVSQYDKTPPYTSNYEIIPRMQDDIKEVSG